MPRFVRLFVRALFLSTFLAGMTMSFSLSSLSAAGPSDPEYSGISLSIHAGCMSATLTGETMESIMESVARQTGISISVEKSLLDLPRTVHFRDLPMEAGLKKLIGRESYAMVFSSTVDLLGNHPVKSIRVYPRGKPDAGPSVQLRPSQRFNQRFRRDMEFSREEIDAILTRNEKISRSAVARRIERRKNRPLWESASGRRTLLQESIYRAKQARRFKGLRSGVLARRNVLEAEKYARLYPIMVSRGGKEDEHKREEILREGRLREAQRSFY
ncbi:MAG: hypothetical protein GXP58_08215 [Deltaproteobacteria bacterium]|nr:hypothetical protein [Deltaproteobacteria bacterium]